MAVQTRDPSSPSEARRAAHGLRVRRTGGRRGRLRVRVRRLYFGHGRTPRLYRTGLLALDLTAIVFFVVATFLPQDAVWPKALDVVMGVVFALELAARLSIVARPWRYALEPFSLADLVVIGTLLLSPLIEDYAFLRVLRALRIIRSYHVIGALRRRYGWCRRNDELILGVVNLIVFLHLTTALVFVTQHGRNSGIMNYVDALYFTATTLTTTGFGDVTLVGNDGRLLAVAIMIVGISLFLRLLQMLFRPNKVRFPCPDCGLSRHDTDAVHCRHCGRTLNIPDEGFDV